MKTHLNTVMLGLFSLVLFIGIPQFSFSQGFDEPVCAPPSPDSSGSSPPIRPVIIYCIVSNDTVLTTIPEYLVDPFPKINDYFTKTSFNEYPFEAGSILTRDNLRPFRSSYTFNPGPTTVPDELLIDILAQVDSLYDLGPFDHDCDDTVDYVMFTLLNFSARGRGWANVVHQSADVNRDGNPVVITLNRPYGTIIRKAPSDVVNGVYDYLNLWFHETGHSIFYFKDMEHDGPTLYPHYGLGSFDIMSGEGFNKVPSPYNPWHCFREGWGNFRKVTSNLLNYQMNDFYQGGEGLYVDSLIRPGAYAYHIPYDGYSYQKFFVTYHRKNQENEWTKYWPVDLELGGVMIWHLSGQPDGFSAYESQLLRPIDIEAAHGKYNWTVGSYSVTNTMVPNPISGFDSLEIRKIGIDPSDGRLKELQGPYYHQDWGSESIPYSPNSGREFTPSTNPSSALYATSDWLQRIFSDIAVKNIFRSNDITTLSFFVNAPPSAPNNLQLSTLNQHPHLVWEANTEPDFAKYYINRNGTVIDSTTDTSWTDIEAIVIGQSPVNATYFVTARDSSFNISDPSNSVGARVRWEATKKPSSQSEPKHFSVSDNYPNPFNPSTSFEVNLSIESYLRITVMDILGREVVGLSDKKYESGEYRFAFDGTHLPSGVYFCKVEILSPSEGAVHQFRVFKMVLAK